MVVQRYQSEEEFSRFRNSGNSGQESRKFGSMITARAKTGVRGTPSGVLSYVRLFSSDEIAWAVCPGGGARLQE